MLVSTHGKATKSFTYVGIDHEIISMAIFLPPTDSRRIVVSYKRMKLHEVLVNHLVNCTVVLLPSVESRRVVVSYNRMYVHKILVNRLVKLAHEKSVVR